MREVPDPGSGEDQGDATDEHASVDRGRLRVSQGAPCDEGQENGNDQVEGAHEVRTRHSQACREPSIDTEPHRCGDDDGQCDQQQTEAIPAMDVLQIPRPGTNAPGTRADDAGEAQPQTAQSPSDRGKEASERTRAVRACRPRRWTRRPLSRGRASSRPGSRRPRTRRRRSRGSALRGARGRARGTSHVVEGTQESRQSLVSHVPRVSHATTP